MDISKTSPTEFSNNKQKQLPNKIKYLTAINLFYGYFAGVRTILIVSITANTLIYGYPCVLISYAVQGAAVNSLGPVITTIQNKYDVDDATISKTFTIFTGCGLLGTLIGGVFIFDRVNRQLAVIIVVFIKALAVFIIPHCASLTTYFVTIAFLGLAFGAYDGAQFVWMLEMMQKECPPFVQTQHFSWSVGTILGPLLMAPFLKEDSSLSAKEKADKLILPFSILGALLALNATFQLVLFTFFRYFKPPPEEVQDDLGTKMDVGSSFSLFGIEFWRWPKLRFVLLCCAFFGAYQGMEMTTFEFFPKFAQNSDLKLVESEAAYVFSGMTGGFAAGRGIAIILVLKINSRIILCVNILLLITANILLIGWASSSITILWAASILYGLGFSCAYASFSIFMERYLNITNLTGSLLLIFANGVAAIYPLILGNFIDTNPVVLGYIVFCSISVIIFAVGVLSFLTHKNKIRY